MKTTVISAILLLATALAWQGAANATGPTGWTSGGDHDAAPAKRKHERRGRQGRGRIRPPAGYSGFLVFLENGVFDPTVADPVVPGCFQYFCSGEYYHVTLRGRSLAQVLAIELDAKLFFIQRFGVDVDDPANAGRLFFRRYYRDPRSNLHAVVVSGRGQPRQVWSVDDGGWDLVFLDDYALGGEFGGQTIAAGSTLSWGEYVITPTGRRAGEPIVMSYRSAIPPVVRFPADGPPVRAFQHELYPAALDDPENDWANSAFPHLGLDQGVEYHPVGLGGEISANGRHVLTFSEDGGL